MKKEEMLEDWRNELKGRQLKWAPIGIIRS
jgi:hypothetical protein